MHVIISRIRVKDPLLLPTCSPGVIQDTIKRASMIRHSCRGSSPPYATIDAAGTLGPA